MRDLRVVNPRTGEVLRPADVASSIESLIDELSRESDRLTGLIGQHAHAVLLLRLTTAEAIRSSTASSSDRRAADAAVVASLTCAPGDSRDLLTRESELGAEVKALREAQHTRRAMLDGLRSASASLRAELEHLGSTG